LSIISKNEVTANIAEKNIAQIKIGQNVLISADAFPDEIFEGRVSKIATQATVEQNVTSFEVTVTLVGEKAHRLKAGMNISADFQIGQKEDVLTIPTIAVTRKDNVTGVFVGSPNQPPRFVPITIGTTIDDRTEVKDGLKGDEHILLNVGNSQPPPPPSGFSFRSLFGGLGGNNRPDAPPPPPNGSPPPSGGNPPL
jgi:HlyD family secretion protein